MSAYDVWLEKPYQDRAAIEEAHERFQESTPYEEAFQDWADEMNAPIVSHGPYVRRKFEGTPEYADAFEEWMSPCE